MQNRTAPDKLEGRNCILSMAVNAKVKMVRSTFGLKSKILNPTNKEGKDNYVQVLTGVSDLNIELDKDDVEHKVDDLIDRRGGGSRR